MYDKHPGCGGLIIILLYATVNTIFDLRKDRIASKTGQRNWARECGLSDCWRANK
jgi:hypothetical protein